MVPKVKIKEVRQMKGLKQNELAKLANISPSYLCELEKNLKSPTLRHLHKIAKALDTRLEDLIYYE